MESMVGMRLILVIGILISARISSCDEYKVTDQVYLEVEHGGKYVGKIVIGLFGEIAPRTVHNFKAIATAGINGKTYGDSTFHRVIQRFMIQGGDVITGDGTNSVSVYGGLFADENFLVKHNAAGLVSMANNGPDTNGCQFFITTIATPWLDDHHTVFGKVILGQDIVHTIEHIKTDSDDVPLQPVKIIQSGLMETSDHYYISDEPYTYSIMQWIQAASVPLSFSFIILAFFQWAIFKLDGFKLL